MDDGKQFSQWLEKSNHEAEFISHVRQLIEVVKDVREINALMAEGEGDDVKVYKTMARSAMDKADRILTSQS